MDTAPDDPDYAPDRSDGPARATTVLGADGVRRCAWSGLDAEYQRYHDEEWGRPLRGDRELFEKISLEGFQSGLSWITILRRREAFRSAFRGFEPEVVARMDDDDVVRLMGDASIIRNRRKIEATIANARAVLALDEPLSAIVWRFASEPGHRRRPRSWDEVPATTAQSTALSSELKARGRADEADGRSAGR